MRKALYSFYISLLLSYNSIYTTYLAEEKAHFYYIATALCVCTSISLYCIYTYKDAIKNIYNAIRRITPPETIVTDSSTEQPKDQHLTVQEQKQPLSLRELQQLAENESLSLLTACKNNDLNEATKILSESTAQHDERDAENNTPLIIACKNNNKNMVTLLLMNSTINLQINQINKNNENALYIAKGHTDSTILMLLADHKDIDIINILRFLININENEKIQQLCEKRNITITNNELLDEACRNGNVVIAKLFIEKKMYKTTNIISSLEAIIRWLVGTTQSNYSPFIKITRILSSLNASEKFLINDPNCLQNATIDCQKLKLIIPFLKDNNAVYDSLGNMNTIVPQGNLLHEAFSIHNKDSIDLLLDNGADIAIKNRNEETPLDMICRFISTNKKKEEYFAIINHLLNTRKNLMQKVISASDSLCNAITYKGEYNEDLLKLLIANGANPNKPEPLRRAAISNLALLNTLIDDHRCSITTHTAHSSTILHTAYMNETITGINTINFFRKLLAKQEKNMYMMQELSALACCGQRYAMNHRGWFYDKLAINNQITKLLSFIELCLAYGEIEITQKKKLLKLAQEEQNRRTENFTHHNCMFPKENICWKTHDLGHFEHGCDDCRYLYGYNELVKHCFLNVFNLEKEHKANTAFAKIVLQNPVDYYFLTPKEQKNQLFLALEKHLSEK